MVEADHEINECCVSVFKKLEEAKIPCVLTHKWEGYPDLKTGMGIEVLVDANNYTRSLEILENYGLKSPSPEPSSSSILSRFAANPLDNVVSLLRSPKDTMMRAVQTHREEPTRTRSNNRLVTETILRGDDVSFRVLNHLGYIPLIWEEDKLRVSPRFENDMLKNRVGVSDSVYIASAPDELAHLVCEGVFDYGGRFPTFHKRRCTELWMKVQDDVEEYSRLIDNLSILFYNADSVVLEGLQNQTYDNILPHLKTHADY